MLARLLLFCVSIIAIGSCINNTSEEQVENTDNEPKCSFQIQSIQNLVDSHYKLVGGRRTCDDNGQVTKEIVVFAEGEPINNHKECNLFATSDTTAVWNIELSPLKIEILFNDHIPADSLTLMKVTTLYDSIEVIYSISNATAI